jgi:four helix bundle protein
MKDFRRLSVWERSHALTLDLYRATASFPKAELYGLTSQMRRASVSIPGNIAEGCGRSGDPEFARFLQIALGSSSELDYYLLLSHDLEYLAKTDHAKLQTKLDEARRMLVSLIQKVRRQ